MRQFPRRLRVTWKRHSGRTPNAAHRSSRRESTITAACRLSRAVPDAADTCHHCRGGVTGAQPAPRHRVDAGLRMRGRALRRRAAGPCARFSTGRRTGWRETGARAPTATCRPTASSSRPRAPRRDSSSCSGGAAGIRMPTIRCFGPSMRTISGPTATPPAISAIFARTVSSGSRSRCRRSSGSIDPATNAVSNETFVDVWRMVPYRQRRRLDRTGREHSRLATRPESDRRISIGRARHDASGAGPRCARQSRTDSDRTAAASSTTCPRSNGCCSRTIGFARLSDAVREGSTPLPDPGSAAQRSRTAGQGRVRASVQPVPRRSRAVDPGIPGEPIQHHLEPVSASRGHRDACSLRVRAMSAPARPQRADLRDRAVSSDAGTDGDHSGRDQGAPHELRSRSRAVDRVRRRPWPQRRLGQVRRARAAGAPRNRPLLPQQQRRHARRRGRSLCAVLQADRGARGAGCRLAGRVDRRRAFRSGAASRRACGAARRTCENSEPVGTADD